MAHVKSGGATNQHHQRSGKRLGVKIYGGSKIKAGQIILRQRGQNFHPGENVQKGRDFTLFSLINGIVNFRIKRGVNYVQVSSEK